MRKWVGWFYDPTFLLAGSYTISYVATRYLRGNIAWNLIISEQHIHHWQWALLFMVLIFIMSRYFNGEKMGRFFDLAGGTFMGIMFDEFDMWWSDLPSPNDNTHRGFFVGLAFILLLRILSKLPGLFRTPR